MVLNNGEHGWCKQAGTPGGACIGSNLECRLKAVGERRVILDANVGSTLLLLSAKAD